MNLFELHKNALPIVEEAAKISLDYFGALHDDFEDKYDDTGERTVVTKADKEINDFLSSELVKIFPESGVIGEESEVQNVQEYNWILDPIDGTGNFQKGLDHWAISVALWEKNHPQYAIVYYPLLTNKYYYAIKNNGAFDQNDNKLTLINKSSFKPAYSINTPVTGLNAFFHSYDFGEKVSYRHYGAAVYDAYNLFTGGFDFNIVYKLSIWDIAAIILILKEIGYIVDFFEGETSIDSNQFLDHSHTYLVAKPDIYEWVKPRIIDVLKMFFEKKN